MKKAALCLVFLLAAGQVFAGPGEEKINGYARAAVEDVYSLRFESARKNLDAVNTEAPGHPYFYFGTFVIEWMKYEFTREQSTPAQEAYFKKLSDQTITAAEAWLKKHPGDAQGLVVLGGAQGMRGVSAMANKSWVAAYFSARKGIKNLHLALAKNPELYDVYYGLGMYEYYAGSLPSVFKFLAKIVAVKGEAAKGAEYLELAKEKALFMKDSSTLTLVELYGNRNTSLYNPQKSLEYILEMQKKYPQNPRINFIVINALYENKNYDSVIKESWRYLAKINKEPFYTAVSMPRAYNSAATAFMAKEEYSAAADILERARKEAQKEPGLEHGDLWNAYRLAQCYDALGRRSDAEELYKYITARKTSWGINELAAKYLKTPFAAGAHPGALTPP